MVLKFQEDSSQATFKQYPHYGLHKVDARHMLEVFPQLKSGKHKQCIDITVTSPPYWNLKNYNFEGQIGYRQSYDEYLNDLEKVFASVYKITKDTGSLWIVVDTFKKKNKDNSFRQFENGELVPLPFDIIARVKLSGWKLKDIIIWEKDKTLPWSRKGQLRNIFEYILFFTKTNNFRFYIDRIRISDTEQFKEWWVKYPERYNPNGIVPTDIWKYGIPVQGRWAHGFLRHFCPFPVSLVERILLLTTNKGNTVLDPFAGSGVVLAVAECLKRKYVGFELNSEYVNMFHKHVLTEVRKEMNASKKAWKSWQRKQANLKNTINGLRLIKYPKILARHILHQKALLDQNASINTIFAIGQKLGLNNRNAQGKWKFLREDIYLVFEHQIDKAKLQDNILDISAKPPLSKFGIEPQFCLLTHDEFLVQEASSPSFDHENLWLYEKGVVNTFDKHITFEKWQEISKKESWRRNFGNVVPPIVSNVRVKQPLIKDRRPKEFKNSVGVFRK
jgi:DNA modification methylase